MDELIGLVILVSTFAFLFMFVSSEMEQGLRRVNDTIRKIERDNQKYVY